MKLRISLTKDTKMFLSLFQNSAKIYNHEEKEFCKLGIGDNLLNLVITYLFNGIWCDHTG